MHFEIKSMPGSRWAPVVAMFLLIGGCASTVSEKTTDTLSESAKAAETEAAIIRPSTPTRVKSESFGLTVTESVRVSSDARDIYADALSLLENDDVEAGIARLNEVIEEAPELTTPYIALGTAYTANGDFSKAEENLKHALILTPEHPVALNELGIVYRKTGRFQLARESYEQALAIYRDFHYAHRNLGVLCDLFLQDLKCALAHYEEYQKAFPDDPDVEIWIADVRLRMEPPR